MQLIRMALAQTYLGQEKYEGVVDVSQTTGGKIYQPSPFAKKGGDSVPIIWLSNLERLLLFTSVSIIFLSRF